MRELNADLEARVLAYSLARGRTWQLSPDLIGVANGQGYFETSNPAWRKVLGRTAHAQQLRQASPLVTLLPESVRQSILAEVGELKRGVEVGKGVRARARQMHGSDGDSS